MIFLFFIAEVKALELPEVVIYGERKIVLEIEKPDLTPSEINVVFSKAGFEPVLPEIGKISFYLPEKIKKNWRITYKGFFGSYYSLVTGAYRWAGVSFGLFSDIGRYKSGLYGGLRLMRVESEPEFLLYCDFLKNRVKHADSLNLSERDIVCGKAGLGAVFGSNIRGFCDVFYTEEGKITEQGFSFHLKGNFDYKGYPVNGGLNFTLLDTLNYFSLFATTSFEYLEYFGKFGVSFYYPLNAGLRFYLEYKNAEIEFMRQNVLYKLSDVIFENPFIADYSPVCLSQIKVNAGMKISDLPVIKTGITFYDKYLYFVKKDTGYGMSDTSLSFLWLKSFYKDFEGEANLCFFGRPLYLPLLRIAINYKLRGENFAGIFESQFNYRQKMESYLLLNLAGEFYTPFGVIIFLKIKNILNQEYKYYEGFREEGLKVYLGARGVL